MNARDWALLELDARRLPGWKPQLIPRQPRDRTPPTDPRDLALAERIVIGVIKTHALLVHVARHHSKRSEKQIDPLVMKVLAVALYQLRFMGRIPASAAVDEAVEQCRRFGRARAAGFVNAVLRNATRQPDVPLPDPQREREAHAQIALSHPRELFRRLTRIMSADDVLAFCRHDNAEPPTLVRLFRGVSADQITAEGIIIVPHEQSGIHVVIGAKRVQIESWAKRGLAQVQDATSARAVEHMDLRPGQRTLDRCSGLGTKTLQMREQVGPGGAIVAVDPSPQRCEGLRAMLAARRIENVTVHQVGMLRDVQSVARGSLDRILIDVPCSNSGVLARRPEARYAQDDRSLRSLERLQRDILDDTAPYLARGGLLVYSTCSVWPQENEEQVRAFVERHGEFEPLESRATLPSFRESDPARYHDGGFVSVLRRK
jgi:16S rRNA (cytosine967-C5)-methyltransferase